MKRVSHMKLINTALDYMSARSCDRNLSIDDIAIHVGMSRRNFTELFYKHIGQTVHAYLTAFRLFSAHVLLRSSTESVAKIAEDCGFANSSHLSSCFKKAFGCTPLQFRREYCDWQIKYGDLLYRNVLDSMKWFFQPDEAALIRHWTSMNLNKKRRG